MRRARWMVAPMALAAAAVAWITWPSDGEAGDTDAGAATLETLVSEAVSGDPATAEAAITALRERGADGHAALMHVHAPAIATLRGGRTDEALERVRNAVDRVSGQRDGHASGLYWHTDLEAAKDEAARTGRPILSLRLLGRLDEELSCANSRYFRIVLYADPDVATRLRERYVLHWSSERPAPRITIDMGDGRRIVRTITGNSVHYVLDERGRPVDAIVGLYSPAGFVDALETAEGIFGACGAWDGAERAECLGARHAASVGAQETEWETLRERDPSIPSMDDAIASLPGAPSRGVPSAGFPSARAAMPLTVGKSAIETGALGLMDRVPTPPRRAESVRWRRVGLLASGVERPAPPSARVQALLRLKMGRDGVDAVARRLAEVALTDGARNEVLFRRRIHSIFRDDPAGASDFATLNRRVYDELLLTPADDPWLGLRADDLYDGVDRTADAGE